MDADGNSQEIDYFRDTPLRYMGWYKINGALKQTFWNWFRTVFPPFQFFRPFFLNKNWENKKYNPNLKLFFF